MIKIGFELEVDEGACVPSTRELTQALRDALPKEWWADHREADWGVVALFALNDDGTMMQTDHRLRPKDWEKEAKHWKFQFDALIHEDRGYEKKIEKLEALLAQERRLTKHLDGIVYKKNRRIGLLEEEAEGMKMAAERIQAGRDKCNEVKERILENLQDVKATLAQQTAIARERGQHIEDLKERIAFLKQKLAEAEEQYTTGEDAAHMANQERDLRRYEAQVQKLVDQANRKDTAIVGLHETISSLESEVRVITDDADAWMGRYDDCSHVSAKQKVRIDKLGKEIQDLVAEANRWKREAEEAKVDKWFHADQAIGQSSKIQELEAKLVEFEKEVYDQGQRIENLVEKNGNQYETINVLQRRNRDLTDARDRQYGVTQQLRDDVGRVAAQVDEQADRYVALRHKNGQLLNVIGKKNKRIEKLRNRVSDLLLSDHAWGNDEQLTRLETAYEQAKGYVESANGETDTALAYLDDLGALLDEVRTER